jgi:hypothetical protein
MVARGINMHQAAMRAGIAYSTIHRAAAAAGIITPVPHRKKPAIP